MIYSITLNPAIDKAVTVGNFQIDEVNRVTQIQLDPGGKGINVTKMVKNLGGSSIAIMILAGSNGDMLTEMLDKQAIRYHGVTCKGNTRVNLKINDPIRNTFTDINEPGPIVNIESIEAIDAYLRKVLRADDVMTLSGSLPQGVPQDIYKHWCELASEVGAKVILDADREAFLEGIKGKPFLIKPNQDELEAYFGVKFNNDVNMVDYARTLIEEGIAYVVVSQGSKGCTLISSKNVAKISPIDVDVLSTVGAGDSMVAAIASGLVNILKKDDVKLAFENMVDIVAYGVAASSASIEQPGTLMGQLKRVKELYEMVYIKPWNK